jgi:hypothetical protein
MDYNRQSNGWVTLIQHYGFAAGVFIVIGGMCLFNFFSDLDGMPWIRFFAVSEVFLFSGAALILYAKMPVYRSGRFFTFGVKSIPRNLKGFYRWGWRVFLVGVALSLCLMLSK